MVFGANAIDIEEKPILKLLVDEVQFLKWNCTHTVPQSNLCVPFCVVQNREPQAVDVLDAFGELLAKHFHDTLWIIDALRHVYSSLDWVTTVCRFHRHRTGPLKGLPMGR